jgi:putative membrane protein
MTIKPFHPRTLAAVLAAGTLALTLPALAQQGRQERPGTAQQELSAQDRKFMTEAAQGGMMEVQAGQMASEKAQSAAVKEFGRRMVQDHGKANAQLEQTAGSLGLTLPKELSADHRQHMDKLSRLTGAAFDAEYMKHMVHDHQKDVAAFEKQAEGGGNPALRSFAQQTLPTLREHLKLAQQLAGQHGGHGDHGNHGDHGPGR